MVSFVACILCEYLEGYDRGTYIFPSWSNGTFSLTTTIGSGIKLSIMWMGFR